VGETSPGETLLLRMYGPLGQHADSVVAPLLLPGHAGRHLVAGRPARGPRRRPDRGPVPAPDHRRGGRRRAPAVPDRARGRLPAGRHRPELDQGDPLAVAARRHARPAARHDPGRHGPRRAGEPERRPDRRLAGRPAADPGGQRGLGRPRASPRSASPPARERSA
jgi:hypothetical protein